MSKSIDAHKSTPVINTITELLAHSLALEIEAVERYADLAEAMATHNNQEVAQLFKKMSDIEQLHVEQIRKQIHERKLTKLPSINYQWISMQGPETTDPSDLHYLMTPYQALTLALLNEQRARDYYKSITDSSSDEETQVFAGELAEEEEQHVTLIKEWLAKHPETNDDWDYDDDPPNIQD